MIPQYARQGSLFEYITEMYVASPPAAYVISEDHRTFTLGFQYQEQRDAPNGHFAFNVLVDGQETGEFASHIERRNGKVRIFTRNGYWKTWNGRGFV